MSALVPHRFRLRLDTADGTKDRDRAIEDAQRALHFRGEVDVARGVDNVDAVVPPETGRGRGGDGDASLLLLLHPIHGRSTLVHFTQLVGDAGVVENALRRRCLTGIDVRHDANIARSL